MHSATRVLETTNVVASCSKQSLGYLSTRLVLASQPRGDTDVKELRLALNGGTTDNISNLLRIFRIREEVVAEGFQEHISQERRELHIGQPGGRLENVGVVLQKGKGQFVALIHEMRAARFDARFDNQETAHVRVTLGNTILLLKTGTGVGRKLGPVKSRLEM
jgi:hypothetical protein